MKIEVLHDQHVHTKYSLDSTQDIKEYLDKAKELGLSYFITTDHVDYNIVMDGKDYICDINKEKEELDLLQSQYPSIKIMQGIEIGYKKIYESRIKEFIKRGNFSLINLSIHDANNVDFHKMSSIKEHGVEYSFKLYYSSMNDLVTSGIDFDVLTHIDYCYEAIYHEFPEYKFLDYKEEIVKILKQLIKLDKCLEINTKIQERLNDDDHLRELLSLYKSLGGQNLTISSDVHSIERYRNSFDKYIKIIKEAGFDHLCYFVDRKRFEFPI